MKRLLAWILSICILLSTSGCFYSDFSPVPLPSTSDRPQTEPTQPTEAEMPFSYSLTQEDVDGFYSLLEESEKLALESTDFEAVDQLTDQLDEQYNRIEDQCAIAQILYYCDMSDEAASRQYLDTVDIAGDANDAYMQMVRRICQSEAPTKEQLFADWTQQELDMLMAYTPQIMELQKRNSEILVQYQALEDRTSDAMIPLYAELVQNYNRMAQIYGYDNYYTYAYQMGYTRDYSQRELKAIRTHVANYLVPIFENAYNAYYEAYDQLGFIDQMTVSAFMTNAYDDCSKPYVRDYMDTLPEGMAQSMGQGLEEGSSYFTENENAYPGAFTTVIGEQSFCFFGPGYTNSLTVAHELGHYYGSLYSDLDALPLDLAETQSQGNEWLFLGYLSEHMDAEVFAAQKNMKLYNDLGTILVCILVDAFEERIYSEPNLASFTAADFNRVMEEVCAQYGGIEYISYWVTDIQSYWRTVVLESPVYYISYAVSAVAAMNLYTMYQDDPQAAVEAYRLIIETEGEDQGFLQTIQAAGLPGPFDESVYIALAQMYS